MHKETLSLDKIAAEVSQLGTAFPTLEAHEDIHFAAVCVLRFKITKKKKRIASYESETSGRKMLVGRLRVASPGQPK